MNITLLFSKLADDVNRSLAIIAKRSKDADGNPLYGDLTLSTAEQPLLYDYFRDAIVMLNTETQQFITASELSDSELTPAVTLTFPDNHNNAMNTTITLAITSFCVAYALYAWFSVVEPKLVERYKQEMADKLAAIIRLIWHKAPPSSEYTYDLPPRVNTPGDTVTLSTGQQILIAYTLGSDGVDDLVINSSVPTIVAVAKNADSRVFSIINSAPAGFVSGTAAVITVIRSTTSEELARITVMAMPSTSSQTVVTPVLVGYKPLSDSVTIQQGETVSIPYTGSITRLFMSSGSDVVSASMGNGVIEITARQTGNAVLTLYADGWVYVLYVTVAAVQATAPVFNVPQQVSLNRNQTTSIPYSLGSDGVNDLTIQSADASIVTATNDKSNRLLKLTGVSSGTTTVSITSVAHPEVNTSFSVVVAAAQQNLQPVVYGYDNGETINTVTGADAIRIHYFPGSTGSFVASASPSSNVTITGNTEAHYIELSPKTAGNVTITFSNSAMSWSRTLRLAIAERPVVVTPPTLFWPNNLSLQEQGGNQSIYYTLGNDNRDTINMAVASATAPDGSAIASSELSTYLTITKDSEGKLFTIIPLKACTAVIRVYDNTHGISEYHTVDVEWVEPEVMDYEDGDTITLTSVYESGEPEEGVNAIRIQYREPSSGNITVSYLPSGNAATHNTETIPSSHSRPVTNLLVKALREGQAYVMLTCPTPSGDTWSFKLRLKIGSAVGTDTATITPKSLNLTAGGNAGTLTLTGGTLLSAQSSNTDLATVTTNGNVITVTPLAAGTIYINATTVAGTNLSVACFVQAAGDTYVPPTIPGYANGNVINLHGRNSYELIDIDITNSSDTVDTLSCFADDASKVDMTLTAVDTNTVRLKITSLSDTNESTNVYITSNHPSSDGWERYFQVYTAASGQQTSISQYDGSFGAENDHVMYYKGTVNDVTNPCFDLDEATMCVYLIFDSSNKILCYDEYNGTAVASSALLKSESAVADVLEAIIDSLTNRYGKTINNNILAADYPGMYTYDDTVESINNNLDRYVLPYTNNGGSGTAEYFFLNGTIEIDQNLTITNPIIQIKDGVVKTCIDSSERKFLVCNNWQVRTSMYPYPNIRQKNILDAAVSAAASEGVTLTYNANDSSTWFVDFANTNYPKIGNYYVVD